MITKTRRFIPFFIFHFYHTPDLKPGQVVRSHVRLLDASPLSDGAAAVVLTSNPNLADLAGRGTRVQLAGSGAASDILAIRARPEPLHLEAVGVSFEKAIKMAKVDKKDIDVLELHDAYTIMACLSLESNGIVPRGEGVRFAADGGLGLKGAMPISTFGGLKERGHPVGASGIYQLLFACILQRIIV